MRSIQKEKTFQEQRFTTGSADKTRHAGEGLSSRLVPGDVVSLRGEMGSGKTTFAQGVARGFGIGEFIRSSSFMLVNEYAIAGSRVPLYHIDLYRLEKSTDIESIGIDDYLFGSGICILEWAQRMPAHMMPRCWDVEICWRSENEREIVITPPQKKAQTL